MQGLGVVGGITQRGARSEDEKDVEIRYARLKKFIHGLERWLSG